MQQYYIYNIGFKFAVIGKPGFEIFYNSLPPFLFAQIIYTQRFSARYNSYIAAQLQRIRSKLLRLKYIILQICNRFAASFYSCSKPLQLKEAFIVGLYYRFTIREKVFWFSPFPFTCYNTITTQQRSCKIAYSKPFWLNKAFIVKIYYRFAADSQQTFTITANPFG